MAVTVDDRSTGKVALNSILSIAHAAGTGDDRYMFVGHGNSDSGGAVKPDSVVYDGTDNLAELDFQTNISNTRNCAWGIKANSQTSGNLVITLPATKDELVGGVITMFGVDQTTPVDTASKANGTSSSVSVSVTSATDDLVLDVMYILSDSDAHTQTVGSGQTTYYDELFSAWIGGGGSSEAGSASVTMSWSIGESASWETMGFNINAASAAGVTVNLTGNAATGQIGTLTPVGNASLSLSGVAASSGIGSLAALGYAQFSLSGVAASGQVGNLSLNTHANINITGVQANGQVGTLVAVGDTTISISGVSTTGQAGALTGIGHANVPLTGVNTTGQVGVLVAVVGGSQTVTLTGVSTTGQAGSLSITTHASTTLLGVNATGQVGTLQISGGAVVSINGNAASGQVGQLSAVEAQQITLQGVSASGVVGLLDITGNASVSVTGVQADGQIGTITIDTGITEAVIPGYRIFTVTSEDRTLLVVAEDRTLSIADDSDTHSIH